MKIRTHNDLHLEWEAAAQEIHPSTVIPAMPDDKETILLLPGDITSNYRNARKHPASDIYAPWMRDLLPRFKHVIYVLGNHCLWNGGHYGDVYAYWKGMASRFDNFHVLQNDHVVLDGVRFLGTTLWTDLSNPMDQFTAMGMNDFNFIKVNRGGGDKWGKFSIIDWQREHQLAVRFLEEEIFEKDYDGQTVVLTHHAPSVQSVSDQFAGMPSNCCYYTNLERFMWYGNIALWVHGHMHNSVDYVVGDEVQSTRIVNNPFGYFGESINPAYDPWKIVEIDA